MLGSPKSFLMLSKIFFPYLFFGRINFLAQVHLWPVDIKADSKIIFFTCLILFVFQTTMGFIPPNSRATNLSISPDTEA